jgi:hypothetical protein
VEACGGAQHFSVGHAVTIAPVTKVVRIGNKWVTAGNSRQFGGVYSL